MQDIIFCVQVSDVDHTSLDNDMLVVILCDMLLNYISNIEIGMSCINVVCCRVGLDLGDLATYCFLKEVDVKVVADGVCDK